MTDAPDADRKLLPDEQRITTFGKMLRREILREQFPLIRVGDKPLY